MEYTRGGQRIVKDHFLAVREPDFGHFQDQRQRRRRKSLANFLGRHFTLPRDIKAEADVPRHRSPIYDRRRQRIDPAIPFQI